MGATTRAASNFGPTTPIVAKLGALTGHLKNEITFGEWIVITIPFYCDESTFEI